MPVHDHGGNDIGHRSGNFRFHLSNFGIACFEAARLSAEAEDLENIWPHRKTAAMTKRAVSCGKSCA